MQPAAGIIAADRRAPAGQHRAGVQPRLHLHQADAGLGVAGQDGALDRGRTAPAGQQRGMDIDTPQRRYGQYPGRQDQAVCDDNHKLGLQRRQLCNGGRLPE